MFLRIKFINYQSSETAITCKNQGLLKHGFYECTDGNKVESDCEFTCQGDYVVYPPSSFINTCHFDVEKEKYDWSLPKPCCTSWYKLSTHKTK